MAKRKNNSKYKIRKLKRNIESSSLLPVRHYGGKHLEQDTPFIRYSKAELLDIKYLLEMIQTAKENPLIPENSDIQNYPHAATTTEAIDTEWIYLSKNQVVPAWSLQIHMIQQAIENEVDVNQEPSVESVVPNNPVEYSNRNEVAVDFAVSPVTKVETREAIGDHEISDTTFTVETEIKYDNQNAPELQNYRKEERQNTVNWPKETAEKDKFSTDILKFFNVVSELDRHDCQQWLEYLSAKYKTNATLQKFFPFVKKEETSKSKTCQKSGILFSDRERASNSTKVDSSRNLLIASVSSNFEQSPAVAPSTSNTDTGRSVTVTELRKILELIAPVSSNFEQSPAVAPSTSNTGGSVTVTELRNSLELIAPVSSNFEQSPAIAPSTSNTGESVTVTELRNSLELMAPVSSNFEQSPAVSPSTSNLYTGGCVTVTELRKILEFAQLANPNLNLAAHHDLCENSSIEDPQTNH